MTWKTRLNPAELEELRRAEKARDEKRDAWRATHAKLKNRADARIRSEKKRAET
jgi:hypothetical protein